MDGMADASPDAPAAFICPSEYTVTITATASRYRVITSNATFWSHRTTCNNGDQEATTHVAVLDSISEAVQLKAEAMSAGSQPSQGRFYVGAIQTSLSPTLGGGWFWATGGGVPANMWGQFSGIQQPDDGADNAEAGHDEQLAAFDPGAEYLIDVRGTTGYGAICECDGQGENAAATTLIDADPNNPN